MDRERERERLPQPRQRGTATEATRRKPKQAMTSAAAGGFVISSFGGRGLCPEKYGLSLLVEGMDLRPLASNSCLWTSCGVYVGRAGGSPITETAEPSALEAIQQILQTLTEATIRPLNSEKALTCKTPGSASRI